ncbi:hypothetical protein D3C80_1633280 [compost metagenome]
MTHGESDRPWVLGACLGRVGRKFLEVGRQCVYLMHVERGSKVVWRHTDAASIVGAGEDLECWVIRSHKVSTSSNFELRA